MENTYSLLFYLVLFGAIFYFLIFRPQQRQRRKREQLLNNLEVGREIVTIGGIHGKITQMGENTVTLKLAENVEITAQKNAVGYIVDEEDENESGGSG